MSADIFFLVMLVGVSVLFMVFVIVVAIVRGIRKNAAERAGSASCSAPKGDEVHVITRERDGEILYIEKGNTGQFYWEFLGGDVRVGVSFLKKDQWDNSIP